MKKLVTVLCFVLGSQTLFFAQTADEIIDKYVQALGGKDKLTSIQSIVMQGKVSAQGMEIPVSTTILNNKGSKVEFSVMGMDAWIITCLLYTSDAADERSSVDLGGRRIIKKKKNTKVRDWK